ncbi:hypothetical protein J6590_047267 [Homalodisca vitripennis]|nr:hypothetical protein J6590_047267 [Homalodisca vitripennis]
MLRSRLKSESKHPSKVRVTFFEQEKPLVVSSPEPEITEELDAPFVLSMTSPSPVADHVAPYHRQTRNRRGAGCSVRPKHDVPQPCCRPCRALPQTDQVKIAEELDAPFVLSMTSPSPVADHVAPYHIQASAICDGGLFIDGGLWARRRLAVVFYSFIIHLLPLERLDSIFRIIGKVGGRGHLLLRSMKSESEHYISVTLEKEEANSVSASSVTSDRQLPLTFRKPHKHLADFLHSRLDLSIQPCIPLSQYLRLVMCRSWTSIEPTRSRLSQGIHLRTCVLCSTLYLDSVVYVGKPSKINVKQPVLWAHNWRGLSLITLHNLSVRQGHIFS